MTKEELLEKVKHRFGTKHMGLFSEIIKSLMDEYAKQQSIAFLDWVRRQSTDAFKTTSEHIYFQFIEQQQNKIANE